MLFTENLLNTNEVNEINNFFININNEFDAVETVEPEEVHTTSSVSQYISSLVSGQYAKSIEDIENTIIGNRIKRKRNLTQIMKESFFYGANRFGNNFIA